MSFHFLSSSAVGAAVLRFVDYFSFLITPRFLYRHWLRCHYAVTFHYHFSLLFFAWCEDISTLFDYFLDVYAIISAISLAMISFSSTFFDAVRAVYFHFFFWLMIFDFLWWCFFFFHFFAVIVFWLATYYWCGWCSRFFDVAADFAMKFHEGLVVSTFPSSIFT